MTSGAFGVSATNLSDKNTSKWEWTTQRWADRADRIDWLEESKRRGAANPPAAPNRSAQSGGSEPAGDASETTAAFLGLASEGIAAGLSLSALASAATSAYATASAGGAGGLAVFTATASALAYAAGVIALVGIVVTVVVYVAGGAEKGKAFNDTVRPAVFSPVGMVTLSALSAAGQSSAASLKNAAFVSNLVDYRSAVKAVGSAPTLLKGRRELLERTLEVGQALKGITEFQGDLPQTIRELSEANGLTGDAIGRRHRLVAP